MGLLDGFYSLNSKVNTTQENGREEGIVSDKIPELVLEMDDKELLELSKQWIKNWDAYSSKIEPLQKENERYWVGKQYTEVELASEKRPLYDNRIFSAVETFLPIVTRQNPEPLVSSDNTEEGIALADKVAKMLAYQADYQRLKLKLKKVMRLWTLYMCGVAKVGWDMIQDDIKTTVIRPQKLILDSNATVDEDGYTGEYVGEYRKDKAKILVTRFPEHSLEIEKECENKMDTEVQYIEWWTNDYVFWTMKELVLGKAKNPHWNYGEEVSRVNEFGQEIMVNEQGKNHFVAPKKPYIFLSVFNIGLHPFDDTSLIQQNLALQDLINKRMRQIDKNVDNMNGGIVVSGDHFTQEEASQVSDGLRRGATVWVPNGDVNAAYKRETGPALPSDVYNNLVDARGEVDNIFGTHGASRGESGGEKTVRGKIIAKGSDESRIGFISDYLEQFSDQIFNWWVQLIYVYYDQPHVAVVLGDAKSKEYIELQKDELVGKLLVSVREGSLIPKDPMVKRNEAIDLAMAGLLDPITLFERLDFPNPKKTAEMLVMYKTDPMMLFPELQQVAQQQMAPQGMPAEEGAMGAEMPPQASALPLAPEDQVSEDVEAQYDQIGNEVGVNG